MAYASLVSLAHTIDQILLDGQYPIPSQLKKQIRSIHEHTVDFQTFLEDFPKKANVLEGRIRGVANEAEDIIEHFMWDHIWSSSAQSKFIHRRTGKYTHHLYGFKELKKVTKEMDLIAGEVTEIRNSSRIKHEPNDYDSSTAASSSSRLAPLLNDVVVGFDDDLMKIKSRLFGESSKLQVVPIFGMGGIGKTTLARNAYDDPLIMEHFHLRAWVTVSQDYSAEEIISNILNSMRESNVEESGESNDEKVYRGLKGRRYLIVIDDMWSTNAWDIVRKILPDDNIGSRIMLTTRLADVAAYPDPCSPLYVMCLMDEDQSWNLLRHRVFAYEDCPPELQDIGREIARRCSGLPLAIVVTAGFLCTVSRNPASWFEIADNLNSVVAEKDGQFEAILSLSYTHLPHHLRPCFLYMGGFPEDHEVCVSKLIKLWVAEGFLKCQNGSKSFEEEAGECLENLVKRSLVLVKRRKSNGKIKSCSLHDLMRDMCIRIAREEKFLVNIKDRYVENEFSNQRRASILCPGPLPLLFTPSGSTIRTIMWFLYTSLPPLQSFKLVRVLDAGDADVESLPAELFELFHLRYIAINYHREIPAAISKLQNLQTLIIRARGRWKLYADPMDYLPQEIWTMPQLRHLIFYGALPCPDGTSSSLGTLNLQTLVFSLKYCWPVAILKTIPNLRKLVIRCHYHLAYNLNGLVCLHQLQNLTLRSYSTLGDWTKDDITFPTMLRKLTLSGLRLPWDDMTAVCSLPNLVVLKLRDFACRGRAWDTTTGEFPKLEFLLIEESYLEDWITESCSFPRLKFLLIHDCWRLNEIPDAIGETPTLELIQVKGHVKKSLVKSAKQILEEQQSLGNDVLQVRCITH